MLHFRREERASLVNTLGFFIVCLFGQFVSGVLHALEHLRAADVTHEVFVIGAGIAVIRLWGLLVFRIVLPAVKLSLPRITEDIFVIIAYIAWFMVRLRYAGLDLGSILATSAMITAVVAFAMQDTLGNILGGLALQLDNSIEVGDWIKVDDISGKVVDIRWRSTLVETRNWETVVFPNSQLMKNKFLVLGRRTDQPVQWRRWVWFNVGLDVAPTRVVSVVEDSVLQTEIANVAKNPAPNCVLMDMDDKGYARYALRYWLTDLAADDPTDAILRWHIMTALQRAGIKLAVEEHSIHLTKENEKYDEAVHQREVLLRIKTLRRVELFSQLNDAELQGAGGAPAVFAVRQGQYHHQAGRRALALAVHHHQRRSRSLCRPAQRQTPYRAHAGAWQFLRRDGADDRCAAFGLGHRQDRRGVLSHRQGSDRGDCCTRVRASPTRYRISWSRAAPNWMSRCRILMRPGQHKDLSQQRSEILATIKRFFSLG